MGVPGSAAANWELLSPVAPTQHGVTAIERATVADWKNQSGGMAASWHFGGISAQGARPFLDEANVDVGAEFDERQSLGIGSSPNPDSDTPARYEYDRKKDRREHGFDESNIVVNIIVSTECIRSSRYRRYPSVKVSKVSVRQGIEGIRLSMY